MLLRRWNETEHQVPLFSLHFLYGILSSQLDTDNEEIPLLEGKPKFDLVDTPDCTSIDTSIPEEELLENRVRQRALDYDLGSIDRMTDKEEAEDASVEVVAAKGQQEIQMHEGRFTFHSTDFFY